MTNNSVEGCVSIYILTFNCGRSLIDVDAFSSQLFSGLTSSNLPDLLVLCLEEIAPIPHSFIGGSFLVPYFSRFYYAVQKAARQFSNATDNAPIYDPTAARNLGMTGIMVFAKDPEAIRDIETAGVGVGLAEMGNKGAVGIRLTYQAHGSSTELTFVAAHLAAMESELLRRNEDWKNIVRGLIFASTAKGSKANENPLSAEEQPLLSISPRDATIFKPTSHLIFAGDLNYRTSKFSPAPNDHLDTFPQPTLNKSHPNHHFSLFESDQLNQERLAERTCHGLIEAPVTFPPTYKYDPKEPFLTPDEDLVRWNWAKHRWPSWCDRILYLPIPPWVQKLNPDAKIIAGKYSALPLFPTSDHRAVALELSIPLIPIPSPPEDEDSGDPRINPPFQVNIDWRAKRDRARILELIAGFSMYFTTTKEGGAVMIALLIGAVGAYFAIRAMIEA
jgi:hypothetical protein